MASPHHQPNPSTPSTEVVIRIDLVSKLKVPSLSIIIDNGETYSKCCKCDEYQCIDKKFETYYNQYIDVHSNHMDENGFVCDYCFRPVCNDCGFDEYYCECDQAYSPCDECGGDIFDCPCFRRRHRFF